MRILLFISLICLSANGQITFQENIVTGIENSVNLLNDVETADIDGDGDLDIISSSNVDDKIAWYKNIDGEGTFSPLRIINDDNNDDASSIATADLDGDGDIDILAVSRNESKISWYENLDGLGNFSSQITISTTSLGVNEIKMEDLDGDDDLDIVVTTVDDHKLSWYKNLDGNGNFSAENIITDEYLSPNRITLVDIDNDGDIDILPALFSNSSLKWFENNNADDTFVEHTFGSIFANTNILAGDFDNDSNIDIIVAQSLKVDRYEYSPSINNFDFVETVIDDNTFDNFSLTDFDGDSDIDILLLSIDGDITSNNDDKIYLLRNEDGLGNFVSELITNEVITPTGAKPFDFDNDNDQDFIVISETSDLLISYENTDGNGSFQRKQYIANNADMPSKALPYDIDGDSDLDILVSSGNDNKVAWYENLDGRGNFGPSKVISVGVFNFVSADASDIDGDGDLDVLVTNFFGDETSWYENLDGEGTFGTKNFISTLTSNEVFAGDLDSDGDQDFVVTVAEQNNSISWFENLDGEGDFSTPNIIATEQSGFPNIQLIDINNDDHLDVVASYFSADKIVWFENINGTGNFSGENEISSSVTEPSSLFVSDVDNDGNKDVLVGSQNSIFLYKNLDGLGNFGSREVVASNLINIFSIFASDLDNDGDNDLVCADYDDDKFIWLENLDSSGNFGNPQIIKENANGAISVSTSDIDNDGDQDFITAAQFDNSVSWFSNSLVLGVNQENIVDFKVFPNPASTSLTLLTQDKVAQIEVFNILGELVLQDKDIIAPTVNISSLKSSVYFIKIKTADGKFGVQKFIKE